MPDSAPSSPQHPPVSSQCESSTPQTRLQPFPPSPPPDPSCKISPFKPRNSDRRPLPRPRVHLVLGPESDHDRPIPSPNPTASPNTPAIRKAPKHSLTVNGAESVSNSHQRHPTPEPSLAHIDVPSPPILSSSDDDFIDVQKRPASTRTKPSSSTPLRTDTSNPPESSQDSAFFSFSKTKPRSPSYPPKPVLPLQQQRHQTNSPHHTHSQKPNPPPHKPYYTRAFEYVLEQVLNRYTFVLPPHDLDVAATLRDNLSPDACALFVRIYARKQPQWFRVSHLERAYAPQIDVPAAIDHLCRHNLIVSSVYAMKASAKSASLLARELLSSLDLSELRTACASIVDGSTMRRLSKNRLLPALRKVLSKSTSSKSVRKTLTQTTLSGLSPSDCLARTILRISGHAICIPDTILSALKRIRFLFYLEDGHNSANVMLADIGKVTFPSYKCQPTRPIFPSSEALEEYESALQLEQLIDESLVAKDWSQAAYYGSIAELEVREFLNICSSENEAIVSSHAHSSVDNNSASDSLRKCISSRLPPTQKRLRFKEQLEQLHHPFLRRYTAQWVLVRSCWHSVYALERLSEYQSAVKRLKVLLSTNLVPRRRGKCLERLTIDLFRHLGELEEPFQIIVSELSSSESHLQLGDQIALARRGATIHSKLVASCETSTENEGFSQNETRSGRRAVERVACNLPPVIEEVLKRAVAKVSVRKIFGKSLNVQNKEEKERISNIEDPWQRYVEEGRNALQAGKPWAEFPIIGKSIFMSNRSKGGHVSVEEYCIEWYNANDGWRGIHDEGKSIRFLFSLLLWEHALFLDVPDVFQTPYQDRPLDLFTEAFYTSRAEQINLRLEELLPLSPDEVYVEVLGRYQRLEGSRAVGCSWTSYSSEDIAEIAAGLGGKALSHCFGLLAKDYSYWGGGLPDLILWGSDESTRQTKYKSKLVEVKSARDNLSERQRAWLMELQSCGVECEVCKVVEKPQVGKSVKGPEIMVTAIDDIDDEDLT